MVAPPMSATATAAATQGTAAAQDAVLQAQALGIGTGNPIYYDIEQYTRSTTATAAVLAFLQAWTEQLAHQRLPVGRVQQRKLRDHRPRAKRGHKLRGAR